MSGNERGRGVLSLPAARGGADRTPMAIRMVVLDGHTLVRYALAQLAEESDDIELVGFADSAAGAPELVARTGPDVVTLDVALPDGDGLLLARRLREQHPGLGIVLLTSLTADDVLFRALEIGVSAFVPKTAPVEEVLGAIRHAGVAAGSFTAVGLADALSRRHEVTDRLALSKREHEVLGLLQQGKSMPLMAQEMYVSTSTVKTYVGRLYEKLGASNRAQALMAALDLGLIQVGSARRGPGGDVVA
jgi:DNA-binding NarL/FixJ family response regulator